MTTAPADPLAALEAALDGARPPAVTPMTGAEREIYARGLHASGSDWFERHAVAVEGREKVRRIGLERTPYLVELADCMLDMAHEEVFFASSTQVGKTTLLITMVVGRACSMGGYHIVGFPFDADATKFMKERFRPSALAMDPVRRLLPATGTASFRDAVTLDTISLGIGAINIRGLGGAMATKSDPAATFAIDEPDELAENLDGQGDPIDLARNRLTTKWEEGAKLLATGTFTTEVGHLARRWDHRLDRRRFFVPCPHCGEHGVIVSKRTPHHGMAPCFTLHFESTATPDGLETGRDEAWLACPHCGGEIREADRLAMVRKGRWLAALPDPGDAHRRRETGETIDAEGVIHSETPDGRPIRFLPGETPTPETSRFRTKRACYWLPCFYSPWLDLARIAAELIRSTREGGDKLIEFVNSWLAEPFRLASRDLSPAALERRVVDYKPWQLPAWATHLAMGVDVQDAGLYWLLRAAGPGGRRHTVAFGFEHETNDWRLLPGRGVPESFLRVLEHADRFVETPDGARRMQTGLVLVDTGEGSRTDEIVGWTIAAGPLAAPCKGFDSRASLVMAKTIDRAAGAYELAEIDTTLAKDVLFRQHTVPLDSPDAATFHARTERVLDEASGETRLVDIPLDPPLEVLFRQLSAEVKVGTVRGVRGSRTQRKRVFAWRQRGSEPNHLLDTTVYAEAALRVLGARLEQDEAVEEETDDGSPGSGSEGPAPTPDPAPEAEESARPDAPVRPAHERHLPPPEPAPEPPAPPRPAEPDDDAWADDTMGEIV